MKNKFLGVFGLSALACVACCAAPLLALAGISTAGLAAFFSGSAVYWIVGAGLLLVVVTLAFRKQSCSASGTCDINCGCKTK